MKRPSNTMLVLGHPVVAGTLSLGGAALLYGAWMSENTIVGIIVLVALGKVLDADETARHYKAWRAAWDGLAPDDPRAAARRREQRTGLAITGAVGGLTLLSLRGGATIEQALTFGFVAGLGGALLVYLLRLASAAIMRPRPRRRKRTTSRWRWSPSRSCRCRP